MSEESMDPGAIRAVRGELTRAEFARRLGVTPITVYRWELPADSPQARRPQGRLVRAIRALGSTPPVSTPIPVERAPSRELTAKDRSLLLPRIDDVDQARFARAETDLLALLASDQLETPSARALASITLARIHLLARNDARTAFAALAPLREDLDGGWLAPEVEAHGHVTAALVFAHAEGRLFDAGRTSHHARKAIALLDRYGTADLRAMLSSAVLASAHHLDDTELAARALERFEPATEAPLSPVARCLIGESLAIRAWRIGQLAVADRWLHDAANVATEAGFALGVARAVTLMACRRLNDAAAPDEVLALTRRAAEMAASGRLRPGIHTLVAMRCEGEALTRSGKFEAAEAVLRRGIAIAEEMAWTPVDLVVNLSRLMTILGRSAELSDLGAQLEAFDGPTDVALTRATGVHLRTWGAFATGDATAADVVATARRLEEVGDGPVVRFAAIYALGAATIGGSLELARKALRRVERLLDRSPSAWGTATVQWFTGLLLWREERVIEARRTLEAALATFTLAQDLSGAALVRRTLAQIAAISGEAGAGENLEASTAELEMLGVRFPPRVHPDQVYRAASAQADDGVTPSGCHVCELAVPVQRLAARGVGAALVQRELVGVAEHLFPGHAVRLEELDSTGGATTIAEAGDRSLPIEHWSELGDGSGRRLRFGVSHGIDDGGRAMMTVLTTVAGLALEVAVLRGAKPLPVAAPDRDIDVEGFVAASPAMRRIKADLARLRGSRATVIVTGESGSGKEVVARAVHDLSSRAEHPFVAFNVAAVPRDLFEGQLFGYRKGAFTGAATDHPGVIRAADRGTLFLDEIGELPLDVQPKLLRFLENGEILPLGERRPVHVDVRVVAATHRDLAVLVREGRFREDLFYRLQVVPLEVPPLRERREDIIALARHFLRALAPEGASPPTFGADALSALVAHSWPGNVRELRNTIERALAFGVPDVMTAEHLRLG